MILEFKKNIYIYNIQERIITMEFIDGILLTEIDKLKNQGYDLRKISTIIALTFTNQIFKDGFVHSDPH